MNVEIPCPYLAEGLINLLSAEHTLSLFVSLWQPFSPTQLPALQKIASFFFFFLRFSKTGADRTLDLKVKDAYRGLN